MEKLKISQAIVVEGKYDKIKLSSFIDGMIICTNGFGIFKDKETAKLIRYYAQNNGIIILTDSDSAGFVIRGHIKGICPNGKITNVYIPDVFGKEKRKTAPSKEGKLGVEGINVRILKEAFTKANIIGDKVIADNPITKLDFYQLGITGANDSTNFRKKIASKLNLPILISTKGLLETINTMFNRDEFYEFIQTLER